MDNLTGIEGSAAGDQETARAFSTSWNNLPAGSVYSRSQFEDWMQPLTASDVRGKRVLEMGCGNASLLVQFVPWEPARLHGIDLGDSVLSATRTMSEAATDVPWNIERADLVGYRPDEGPFDLTVCIGVLHHLESPRDGFASVLDCTLPGGRFHCWVYAHEGNAVIRLCVEPLRRVTSRLPWWLTKHLIATPLVFPYYLYAKLLSRLPKWRLLSKLPLADYARWIGPRDFSFFRHVAFDQLVTPQTVYIRREQVDDWLKDERVDRASCYVEFRNGNSWKFGGRRTSD